MASAAPLYNNDGEASSSSLTFITARNSAEFVEQEWTFISRMPHFLQNNLNRTSSMRDL